MTQEEINQYTPFALLSLKKHRIGHQVGWGTICKDISLPEGYWDTLMDILAHKGYIVVEERLDGLNIVRANESVTVALLEIESNETRSTGFGPIDKLGTFGNPDNLNERDVLIHAVKYFQKKSDWNYVSRVFSNIKEQGKRDFINAVLKTSALFQNAGEKGFQVHYKLSDYAVKQLNSKDVEPLVDESLSKTEKHIQPFIQFNDHSKNQTTTVGRDIVASQLNQDSFLEESPIIQRVTTTPNKKDATTIWYMSPVFIYFIWPLAVVLIGGYLIYRLGWI